MLLQTFKYLLYVHPVFIFRATGNKDVIQIGKSEIQASEDCIYEPLKSLCHIRKAEKHAEKLP